MQRDEIKQRRGFRQGAFRYNEANKQLPYVLLEGASKVRRAFFLNFLRALPTSTPAAQCAPSPDALPVYLQRSASPRVI